MRLRFFVSAQSLSHLFETIRSFGRNNRAFKNKILVFMANQQQNQGQLNIELPEEIAEGIYSNLAIISHSNTEFVIDFVRMMPNVPQAKVKSRIILTPEHAKRFLAALMDNVRKFEQQFGLIEEKDVPPFPMNFNTPSAQA
jgi:hypothetical protein